jgi:hypothetical protein
MKYFSSALPQLPPKNKSFYLSNQNNEKKQKREDQTNARLSRVAQACIEAAQIKAEKFMSQTNIHVHDCTKENRENETKIAKINRRIPNSI